MKKEEVEKKINKGFLVFANILVIVWNIFVLVVGVILIKKGYVSNYYLFSLFLECAGLSIIMLQLVCINEFHG
jgi:hypothetical protein